MRGDAKTLERKWPIHWCKKLFFKKELSLFPFQEETHSNEAELSARCSLLVTFYSLLVTFCSLLVFFRPNYCEIKLLRTTKEWLDYNETPQQIFSLQISEILVSFSE